MNQGIELPRILVIDDLFGRTVRGGRNEERANLCAQYLLRDVTGDEPEGTAVRNIVSPVAEAFFCRGQTPSAASVGDTVENDLEGVLRLVRRGWAPREPGTARWSMVLLDLCFYTGAVTPDSDRECHGMPEGRPFDDSAASYFGWRVRDALHDEFPELPVIILSSKPKGEVAREYSRLTLGFLEREKDGPAKLKDYLWRHALIPDRDGEIVGQSTSLLKALRMARQAAPDKHNVLLRGERGTGKELFARYIHRMGRGNSSPLVTVNSPQLTSELFASELFGIRDRTASGVREQTGLIKKADGGDLFFDEIKDMPPQQQAAVLRVLEDRKFTPVGARTQESVDVRFISATNIDIESLAASGEFRADLLDRLRDGGTLVLPRLRDRRDDIPMLVERFVRDAEGTYKHALRRGIEPDALARIYAYEWPGNVRELRSCIFEAVRSNPDVEYLVASHLKIPEAKRGAQSQPKAATESGGDERRATGLGLEGAIDQLRRVSLDGEGAPRLIGKFKDLQAAYALVIARFLRQALVLTGRFTPEHPEGLPQIHPALKLMLSDTELSAPKAADLVKKMRKISDAPEVNDYWQSDPWLMKVQAKARRMRPSTKKKRPGPQ